MSRPKPRALCPTPLGRAATTRGACLGMREAGEEVLMCNKYSIPTQGFSRSNVCIRD